MGAAEQEAQWQELLARYLPVCPPGSIWRFSRATDPGDPVQGWKLHIAATVLSAPAVLGRVAPFLARKGVLFKAPCSLAELKKINCGLFYGFSQVGKCLTVYPRTEAEAAHLARHLQALTRGLPGPAVPYDQAYRPGGLVYYRYGSFTLEMAGPDGAPVPALRTPSGRLVPDRRAPGAAVPTWVPAPFPGAPGRPAGGGARRRAPTPLMTTYLAYDAISQRGKGGVYRALDLSTAPARLCVLKEGRRHGETDWDGRDGAWRVRHEAAVLAALRAGGVPVPEVYAAFAVDGHCYLALEWLEGEDLQARAEARRLAVAEALGYGRQAAELLAGIHAAGWVWRDCKPLNLMATPGGTLRPVDFEGACPVDRPDPSPWGTAGYVPPEWLRSDPPSRVPEDLYALGATLHHLLTGRPPQGGRLPPVGALRQGVPLAVRRLVAALLHPDPRRRPCARQAAAVLAAAAAA